MEYTIDLGSFSIDAESESAAYDKARKMINEDPSWAQICDVIPDDPENDGE